MTRAMPVNRRLAGTRLSRLAVVLLMVAMPQCVFAAISGGTPSTNAIVAKQNQITQFFEAELSERKRLEVGRERYKRQQAHRAEVVASMNATLQAREEAFGLRPVAAPSAAADEPAPESWPTFKVMVLSCVLSGFCYRIYRQTNTRTRAPAPPKIIIETPLAEKARIVESISGSFSLTQLEAEILFWMSEGKANREIAKNLKMSARLLEKHIKSLSAKFGVENRSEVRRFGMELRRF